ncbi:MAG: nitrite reductase small subunit NirD [Candidatus Lambdaproteobacteria bacterium]|nr:nitrite reductase small subunit NirD [Candidatus Lambdaproteobacteria bacterium]
MTDWMEIGVLEDVPRRGARVVRTPRGEIAVFRTGRDELFALDNRCPHRGGPLSEGIVHGNAVTCPLHSWVIDLTSGKAAAPDSGCVTAYPVAVYGARVRLFLTPVPNATHSGEVA